MAMLAERKRKEKWTLNPRGKEWSNDNNKFGQKMLEKMGWSRGKGLGANHQGIVDHVRVDLKNDLTGVGFDHTKNNEKWTEQQENFNDFLQTLQKDTNSNAGEVQNTDISTLSGESLEQKSQFSRARVHYKKFTRGKDVNKYSSKDLANIFGKAELEGVYSPKIEEVDHVPLDPIGTTDKRGGIFTVKGGNNMVDYFAGLSKSANFKPQKRLRSESESESEVRAGFGFAQNLDIKQEPCEVDNFENVTPKKLKKTGNFSTDSTQDGAFENPVLSRLEEINSQVEVKKSKKSKKKSLEGNPNEDNFAFENPCLMSVDQIDSVVKVESGVQDYEDSKKSKKNKKKSTESCFVLYNSEVKKENDFAFENPCLLSVNEIDSEVKVKSEVEDYEVSKRSKKSKKKSLKSSSTLGENSEKNENDFAFENPSLLSVNEIDSETKVKTEIQDYEVGKKSKKNKKKTVDDNPSPLEEKIVKKEDNFAFENPCLMSVNEIDSEVIVKSEVQDYEVSKKSKKSKKKLNENSSSIGENSTKNENDFAFENPCLLSVNEIDSEVKVKSEVQDYEVRVKSEVQDYEVKVKSEVQDYEVKVKSEVQDHEVGKKSKKNKKKSIDENSISLGQNVNNFAFENPCLLSVTEIDSCIKMEDCEVSEKSKKNKKSCGPKIVSDVAFENPCLLGVDKIDLAAKDEPMEVEDLEIKYEEIPKNPKKKNKNKKNFVFHNTGMLDIEKIDSKPEDEKKKKKKKKEKNEFVFDNPCLLDVKKIDTAIESAEAQETTPKKLKKKNRLNCSKENCDSSVLENASGDQEIAGILKEGNCNGAEFEVKRKGLGVVNTGLDIADEKRKKRVTFNDKIEYNTDVQKKKNKGGKLDRYEVENSKMKKKWERKKQQSKNKDGFSKMEVKELYKKNKIFEFEGSNIDEYKGYGVA